MEERLKYGFFRLAPRVRFSERKARDAVPDFSLNWHYDLQIFLVVQDLFWGRLRDL